MHVEHGLSLRCYNIFLYSNQRKNVYSIRKEEEHKNFILVYLVEKATSNLNHIN